MVLVYRSDAQAFEVGVSTSIYNINLVAYGYSGEGVGTTAYYVMVLILLVKA